MNKPLLRKIQKTILAKPEKFDMNAWAEKTDCGTTCCIGGWALVHSGYRATQKMVATSDYGDGDKEMCDVFVKNGKPVKDEAAMAQKLLKIDDEMANSLFFTEEWPGDLACAFDLASSEYERAMLAAARIERLLNA